MYRSIPSVVLALSLIMPLAAISAESFSPTAVECDSQYLLADVAITGPKLSTTRFNRPNQIGVFEKAQFHQYLVGIDDQGTRSITIVDLNQSAAGRVPVATYADDARTLSLSFQTVYKNQQLAKKPALFQVTCRFQSVQASH